MNPMFFGESSSPLFGVYHPPVGGANLNKAVLICSPIAHEHIRSYKAIRNLAKNISAKGYHVMRFDYSGVGDSFGELTDVSLSNWMADISLAYNELVDVSGIKKISLLGVRLGGVLALMSRKKLPVDKTVLWDPVVNVHNYISDMKLMHKEMLVDKMRFRNTRESGFVDGELLGFMFNSMLLDELSNLNVDLGEICEKGVYSYFSNENNEYLEIQKKEQCNDAVFLVEDAGEWNDVRKIGDILLSNTITQKIMDEF